MVPTAWLFSGKLLVHEFFPLSFLLLCHYVTKKKLILNFLTIGQGILKYPHSTAIQRVAFNHSSLTLLSCSDADFGIWSPDQSNVTKEKVTSKILSCSWAYVGNFFAIGLESGSISIRKGNGPELHRIEKKVKEYRVPF